MWIVYALVQVPSGALADRFGEQPIVIGALVFTAVATIDLAVAPTFVVFGVSVLAIGIGAGVYYNPATMLLTRTACAAGGRSVPIGYGELAVAGLTQAVVFVPMLAGLSMSVTPVIQSRMLDGLAADERGARFGVFRTAYLLFGATGTVIVVSIADATGWGPAFGLLSILSIVVSAVAVAIRTSSRL